ncbi:hypothetical protein F2Q70_00013693 [Brassica cretica]|uniref:Uncharacterized protein n=1 Tax=Brassica cretica TaxID=69181 RepID=A0A8S9M0H9_BRACR|nr:hypothetical protein F2Q70_00013693 [Brassica cretica]
MAGSSLPSSLLTQGGPALLFSSSNQVSEAKCQLVVTSGKRSLVRCLAKKKISFVDQILDYIEVAPFGARLSNPNMNGLSCLWEVRQVALERDVKFFTETEENNQMRGPRTGVPYFL